MKLFPLLCLAVGVGAAGPCEVFDPNDVVQRIAVSNDGRWVGSTPNAKVSTVGGRAVFASRVLSVCAGVAFSPDSSLVAFVCKEQQTESWMLTVYKVGEWEQALQKMAYASELLSVQFFNDEIVVTMSPSGVQYWDLSKGKDTDILMADHKFKAQDAEVVLFEHAFDLIGVFANGAFTVLNLTSGDELWSKKAPITRDSAEFLKRHGVTVPGLMVVGDDVGLQMLSETGTALTSVLPMAVSELTQECAGSACVAGIAEGAAHLWSQDGHAALCPGYVPSAIALGQNGTGNTIAIAFGVGWTVMDTLPELVAMTSSPSSTAPEVSAPPGMQCVSGGLVYENTNYTQRAAIAPNGTTVVALEYGATDDELASYDIVANVTTVLRTLDNYAQDVVFSPDGKRLAFADSYNLFVLDASTLEQVANYSVDLVHAIAFSSDGNWLAATSFSRLALYGMLNQKLATEIAVNGSDFHSLTFSPDSKHLAVLNGTSILTYNLSFPTGSLTNSGASFPSVKYQSKIVYGTDGKTIFYHELGVGVVRADSTTFEIQMKYPTGELVDDISISPDGTYLVTVYSPSVKVFDLSSGKQIGDLCALGWATGAQFAALDPNRLIVSFFDGWRVYDIAVVLASTAAPGTFPPATFTPPTFSPFATPVPTEPCEDVKYVNRTEMNTDLILSPDGKYGVSCPESRVVDIVLGAVVFQDKDWFVCYDAAYSADGKYLVFLGQASNREEVLEMFEVSTWKSVYQRPAPGMLAVTYAGAESVLLTSETGASWVSVATGKEIGSLNMTQSVAPAVSADGTTMVGASEGNVYVAPLKSMEANLSFPAPLHWGSAWRAGLGHFVSFSPTHNNLFAVATDDGVAIYDTLGLEWYRGPPRSVSAMSGFSSDGDVVVYIANEEEVFAWNYLTGQEMRICTYNEVATYVAMAPGVTPPKAAVSFGKGWGVVNIVFEGLQSWSPPTSFTPFPPFTPTPVCEGTYASTIKSNLTTDFALSPDGKTALVCTHKEGQDFAQYPALINVESMQTKFFPNDSWDKVCVTVAYSPEGKFLAFSGWSATYLLDAATLAEVHTFESLEDIAFSPNGAYLAGIDRHNGTTVYSMSDYSIVNVINGTQGARSVAFSWDSKLIASVMQGTLEVHYIEGVGEKPLFTAGNVEGYSAAFSPVADHVAYPTPQGVVVASYTATGGVTTLFELLQGSSNTFSSIAYSQDGLTIATNIESRVQLWEAVTGRPLGQLCAEDYVESFVFTGDRIGVSWRSGWGMFDLGNVLTEAPETKAPWVFPSAAPETCTEQLEYVNKTERLTGMAISANGSYVATCPAGSIVDTRSGRLVRDLGAMGCSDAAFSPEGDLLATVEAAGLTLYSVSGITLWQVSMTGVDALDSRVTFANQTYIMFSNATSIALYSAKDGTRVWDVKYSAGMTSVPAITADGKYFAVVTNGIAYVTETATRNAVWKRPVEESGTRGFDRFLAFSPDGRYLAVAEVGTVWLFTFSNGDVSPWALLDLAVVRLGGFCGAAPCLVFSTYTETVIWDYETYDQKRLCTGDAAIEVTSGVGNMVDTVLVAPEATSGWGVYNVSRFAAGTPLPSSPGPDTPPPCDDTYIAQGAHRSFSVALSPDGKTKVTCTQFDTSFSSGFAVTPLMSTVTSIPDSATICSMVVYSPDGKYFAWASDAVHIVDTGTLETVATLGTGKQVVDMEFSPGGSAIAVTSWPGGLTMYDIKTQEETMSVLMNEAGSVAFDPSGKLMAYFNGGSVVVAYAKSLKNLTQTFGAVGGGLDFSQTGIAFSTEKGFVIAAVSVPLKIKQEIETSSPPSVLQFSPDGKTIAAAFQNLIVLYDVNTGLAYSWICTQYGTTDVEFLPDGKSLIFADSETWRVVMRDSPVLTGSPQHTFTPASPSPSSLPCVSESLRGLPQVPIFGLAFSADGEQMAVCDNTGSPALVFVDTKTGKTRHSLAMAYCTSAKFSPLGNTFAVLNWATESIDVYSSSTYKLLVNTTFSTTLGGDVLEYSPDGTKLLLGGRMLAVYDAKTLAEVATLNVSSQFVQMTPDSMYVVAGSSFGEVSVYDVSQSLDAPDALWSSFIGDSFAGFALAPSSEEVIVARNGTLLFYDVASGKLLQKTPIYPTMFGDARFTHLVGCAEGDCLLALVDKYAVKLNTDGGIIEVMCYSSTDSPFALAMGPSGVVGVGGSDGWALYGKDIILPPLPAPVFTTTPLATPFPQTTSPPSTSDKTCSQDWTLRTYQVQTAAIAFSPAADRFATCSYSEERKAFLPTSWTVHGAGQIQSTPLNSSNAGCEALAYDPFGDRLACAGRTSVTLMTASTGKFIAALPGTIPNVRDMAFSKDSQLLVSTAQASVHRWDLNTLTVIDKFPGSTVGVGVAFSSTGTFATTDSSCVTVHGTDGKAVAGLCGTVPARVSFSPDAELIAVASDTGITVRSATTGLITSSLMTSSAVNAVRFSPDGNFLAVSLQDATLPVSNLKTGVWTFLCAPNVAVSLDVGFSSDSKSVIAHNNGGWALYALPWSQPAVCHTIHALSRSLIHTKLHPFCTGHFSSTYRSAVYAPSTYEGTPQPPYPPPPPPPPLHRFHPPSSHWRTGRDPLSQQRYRTPFRLQQILQPRQLQPLQLHPPQRRLHALRLRRYTTPTHTHPYPPTPTTTTPSQVPSTLAPQADGKTHAPLATAMPNTLSPATPSPPTASPTSVPATDAPVSHVLTVAPVNASSTPVPSGRGSPPNKDGGDGSHDNILIPVIIGLGVCVTALVITLMVKGFKKSPVDEQDTVQALHLQADVPAEDMIDMENETAEPDADYHLAM